MEGNLPKLVLYGLDFVVLLLRQYFVPIVAPCDFFTFVLLSYQFNEAVYHISFSNFAGSFSEFRERAFIAIFVLKTNKY